MDNYTKGGAKIVVIGIGGAGNNAINCLVEDSLPVDFYALNSDVQSLENSKVPANHRVTLGADLTQGLGTGGNPEDGKKAAEENIEEIHNIVRGANLVFIAAGMGGGTGTGAAPVVAKVCKEEGALTIAIVTRPFSFEGQERINRAIEGLKKLKETVDSIIVISNDNLLLNNGTLPILEAFAESDKVLSTCVSTISNLILVPGKINLDFADIRNTLEDSGVAMIGIGIAEGPNTAIETANKAINSPLLETPISGAKRAICSITCGANVQLCEAYDCAQIIRKAAGTNLNIIFGISINNQLDDAIFVSIIAADFGGKQDFRLDGQNEKNILESMDKENSSANNISNNSEDDLLPNFLKGSK